MAKLPLEGIRVADITVIYAGPYATMQLADWGAEVIRVESIRHFQAITRGGIARPPQEVVSNPVRTGGIATYCNRDVSFRPWNRWTLFNAHARNKLSCTMDLTTPRGKDLFTRLIRESDVFIESNATNVLESLELSYEKLSAVNPKLIMLSMPGFGTYGPYKYYRGYGAHQENFIGHTFLRGYPDSDPSETSTIFHADEAAGMSAALAVLFALHYRNRTGKGQFIDMAQAEATMPHLGEAIMDYTMNNRVQTSVGNRLPGAVPCGCYPCRGEDRWINITVYTDRQWEGLGQAMGNPPWTKEDKFSDSLSRHKHHDELDELIAEWTIQQDHYALMHLLQSKGIPAGPVIFEDDAYTDPHLKERGFFEELTQAECGTHLYPGLGYRMSKTPNKLRLPPVRLGEHNEYVYKKILNISDEEYVELEKEGHIGMDYDPDIR